MSRILLVDDEPSVLFSVQKCLARFPYELLTCSNGRDAVALVENRRPDVIVLDIGLPDISGLEVFRRVTEIAPGLPVIIVTAFGTTDTAIEAMKNGAFDYLVKPLDAQRLRDVVAKAAEVSQMRGVTHAALAPMPTGTDASADAIVGKSPAMQEVYKAIGRVASQDVTVLILGESGTGKEVVAKTIWRYSNRANQPFVALNCAAIPESLLESELFGYEKGAFTGATERRLGKFEFANGGTVFLDEIGDMSPATQAKVLRVIQERRFERIGGTESVSTDVRIITATNKNLSHLALTGGFRKDLYYRINGFTISLPPLRERSGDIAELTHHFVRRFNREMGRSVQAVAPEAMQWLASRSWPGNVRELQNTIKYAMIKAVGDVLMLDCFPNAESAESETGLQDPLKVKDEFVALAGYTRKLLEKSPGDVYRQLTSIMDNVVMDVVLRFAKGNQLHAAALLGISRTTLRAKMRSLGLTVEKQLAADNDARGWHEES